MTNSAPVAAERVDGTAGTTIDRPAPGGLSATMTGCAPAVLLARVGDVLASARGDVGQSLRSVVELAAAVLGGFAVLRVLTPDLRTVESVVVVHADEQVRAELEDLFQPQDGNHPVQPGDSDVVHDLLVRGRIASSIDRDGCPPGGDRRLGGWLPTGADQFILAPLRDAGGVVGLFGVHRAESEAPFSDTDAELVQLLADGIGAAVGQARCRQEQERAHQRRLQELRHQHRELLERLADMEISERARIGEQIHDEPLQLVVAALLSVDNLIERRAVADADELERAAALLEAAVNRLRGLIGVALTPPDLSAGIAPALRELARGILGQGISFDLVEEPDILLTEAMSAAACRILREALINVRKHAGAQNVTIWLQRHENTVEFSVIDDGVGAQAGQPVAGQRGVATMRARAEAAGGFLRIHGTAGSGTQLTLSLPTGTGHTT